MSLPRQWTICSRPLLRKPPCCTPTGQTTTACRRYSRSPSRQAYPSWWTLRTASRPFRTSRTTQRLGVDMYCFSGGKGLCGPQCAGVLLGRKDLIDAALYNSSPWEGAVCRPMKVGKEEIMGMLAAIEYWATCGYGCGQQGMAEPGRTHQEISGHGSWSDYEHQRSLTEGNSYPTLTVNWDEQKFGLTVAECDKQLRASEPRIDVLTTAIPAEFWRGTERLKPHLAAPARANHLQIISMTLQPGEDLIVGNTLRQILNKARKQASS